MLIDLLSTDNLANYNVKIAQVMGLHTAIYVNELINISNKATQKNKLIVDKFFILDRRYITKRTTLELEEQLAIDNKLMKVDVMQKPAGEVDNIYIDIDKLASMISSDDKQFLDSVTKKTKVKTTVLPGMKQTVKQKQASEMKSYITVTFPELKEAFESWVDGVLANPKGFLSKKAVSLFQRDVDTFANGDLDIALKVIEIATINGYRDASWAINVFNRDYANNFRNRFVSTATQRRAEVADEVF